MPPGSARALAAVDPIPLASDCWSSDNGLPVVSSVQLGATEVDVRHGPVRVPVTVQVDDTGGPGPATGISRVSVVVGVPPAAKQDHAEFLRLDLTQQGPSTWSGTVTVPRVGSGRTWYVFEVDVTDGAGNTRSMVSSYFQAAPWSPQMTVVRPVNSVPPAVLALHATPRVDVRRRPGYVAFRAHVADPDEAATARVVVRTSQQLGDGASRLTETPLRLVSGTPKDGWWRGRLQLRRGTPAGRYRLTAVDVGRCSRRTAPPGGGRSGSTAMTGSSRCAVTRDLEPTCREPGVHAQRRGPAGERSLRGRAAARRRLGQRYGRRRRLPG